MQIDKNIIQGKIDIIEKDLNFLNEYKDKEVEDLLTSYKDIQAVKYSLFEIIEASIDMASHIISAKGLKRPESYAEMFEILGKQNLINMNLSRKLSEMARFRNILVHSYAEVDNSKILNYVKEELKDVEDYIINLLELIK